MAPALFSAQQQSFVSATREMQIQFMIVRNKGEALNKGVIKHANDLRPLETKTRQTACCHDALERICYYGPY